MSLCINTPKFHHTLPLFGKLLKITAFYFAICVSISAFCYEKSYPKSQIIYGTPEAKISDVQHFSLNSPEFLRFIKEGLPIFRKDHIKTRLMKWIFKPSPIDIKTDQLMGCLKLLSKSQKHYFFDPIHPNLNPRTFGGAF